MNKCFTIPLLFVVVTVSACHPSVSRSCNKAEDCGEIDSASDCIDSTLKDLNDLKENCSNDADQAYEDLLWCGGGLSCDERSLFGGGFASGGECGDETSIYFNRVLNCNL